MLPVSELHRAVILSDIEVIRECLRGGADVNARDTKGRTALYYAAQYGQTAVVSLLLELGADLNVADNKGWTPLLRATEQERNDITLLLLERNAKPNAKDRRGRTALLWAAQYGSAKVAELLLQCGVSPIDADANGKTALEQAVRYGRARVVDLLLAAQRSLPARSIEYARRSGMVLAASLGQTKIVSSFLAYGTKINGSAWIVVADRFIDVTTLLAAARNGHLDTVRLLLEYGADVHYTDHLWRTALTEALRNNHTEIVALLQVYGAPLGLKEAVVSGNLALVQRYAADAQDLDRPDENGKTLLMAVVRLGDIAMAEWLLQAGANPNTENKFGETAFMFAAERGSIPLMELLARHGANVQAQTKYRGGTAVTYAAQGGQLDALQWLAAYGADLREFSAIQSAAYRDSLAVIRFLLDHGANPNAQAAPPYDRTPLMRAALRHYYDIVALLLERGADVTLKDRRGTAFYYAATSGSFRTARLLLEHTTDINADSALAHAVPSGNPRLAAWMLAHEADPNAPGQKLKPMIAAAWVGLPMVRLLFEAGADLNIANSAGETPLMKAITRGNTETVDFLIEHGADVDASDTQGMTALILAAANDRAEIIRLLIQRGADVTARDAQGQTALMRAEKYDKANAANVLREVGVAV